MSPVSPPGHTRASENPCKARGDIPGPGRRSFPDVCKVDAHPRRDCRLVVLCPQSITPRLCRGRRPGGVVRDEYANPPVPPLLWLVIHFCDVCHNSRIE